MKCTCGYCGNEFEAKRSTAKFCSATCRVKFNREQKRNAFLHSNASKGDKLAMLMDESEEISRQIKAALDDIRLNRNRKNAWFTIDDLRPRNRRILQQIAELVTK